VKIAVSLSGEKRTHMKALDLFCGLGGWSDGLVMEGFEVLGVEIEPKIARLYKHPVLVEDVRNLKGSQFPGYDLIVGSPPCRDFSYHAIFHGHKWKNPPSPENGLTMVNAFLQLVKEASPTYWLMENAPQLTNHISMKPKAHKVHIATKMFRSFWGNFPDFLVPADMRKPRIDAQKGALKKWERAKIPLPISSALGKAVREAL